MHGSMRRREETRPVGPSCAARSRRLSPTLSRTPLRARVVEGRSDRWPCDVSSGSADRVASRMDAGVRVPSASTTGARHDHAWCRPLGTIACGPSVRGELSSGGEGPGRRGRACEPSGWRKWARGLLNDRRLRIIAADGWGGRDDVVLRYRGVHAVAAAAGGAFFGVDGGAPSCHEAGDRGRRWAGDSYRGGFVLRGFWASC